MGARVKPAAPLPRLSGVRDARSLDNHPNPDAGIVDVPGRRPVVDALAGEGGHAPLKRGLDGQAIVLGLNTRSTWRLSALRWGFIRAFRLDV